MSEMEGFLSCGESSLNLFSFLYSFSVELRRKKSLLMIKGRSFLRTALEDLGFDFDFD